MTGQARGKEIPGVDHECAGGVGLAGSGRPVRIEAQATLVADLCQQRSPTWLESPLGPLQRARLAGDLGGMKGGENAARHDDCVALPRAMASMSTQEARSSRRVRSDVAASRRIRSGGTRGMNDRGAGPVRQMPCSRRIHRVHPRLQKTRVNGHQDEIRRRCRILWAPFSQSSRRTSGRPGRGTKPASSRTRARSHAAVARCRRLIPRLGLRRPQ